MPTLSNKPHISVNNQGDHRICSEQFDFGSLTDYSVNAQACEDSFHPALVAPVTTGADTIFQCNTDQHETVPSYQAFHLMVRAEFNRTVKSDDTEALCNRAAVQTPVSNTTQIVSPADYQTIECAISTTALSSLNVNCTPFDVGGAAVCPPNCWAQPYLPYNNDVTRTDSTAETSFVDSTTAARRYSSPPVHSCPRWQ